MALIFSFDMSVEIWNRQGLLSREKKIYEGLLATKLLDRVFWFTYGVDDASFQSMMNENIVIIPKPRMFAGKIGSLVYSFLLPLVRFRKIRRSGFIKTNQAKGSWTAVLASIVHNIPLYFRTGFTWTLLSGDKRQRTLLEKFSPLVERMAYRRAKVASVTSHYQKDYVIQRYNVSERKISVIPNYVDTRKFSPNNNIVKYDNRIIYVGRLHPEKNIEALIKAISGLDLTLDLYYGDDPIRTELEKLALKEKSRLAFMGSVMNEALPEIFAKYSMFVLPSHRENMPKSLIEAMSCGLCVVGTNVQGINEIVVHNQTGWLVEKDPHSLRQGLLRVAPDENLRKRLGASARESVVGRFSYDLIQGKESDIINKIWSGAIA